MVEATMAEQAERLSRRRARMLPVLAIFYIAQQVSFFSSPMGDRAVDHFKIGAWVVMSIVLLVALVTGGGWIRPRQVRAILNDETSRSHRADALGTGFVVAMVTGIISLRLRWRGTARPNPVAGAPAGRRGSGKRR